MTKKTRWRVPTLVSFSLSLCDLVVLTKLLTILRMHFNVVTQGFTPSLVLHDATPTQLTGIHLMSKLAATLLLANELKYTDTLTQSVVSPSYRYHEASSRWCLRCWWQGLAPRHTVTLMAPRAPPSYSSTAFSVGTGGVEHFAKEKCH